MKTLDQIEPRRAISTLPSTISQPGSYYLTKNLQFTAASGNAITIAVSNVTLDLGGFTLSSSSAVTGDAIRVNANLRNIEIRNGVILGNTTVTISGSYPNVSWAVAPAGFDKGINVLPVVGAQISNYHFSQLRISGCRVAGLAGGPEALIKEVTSTQNGGVGIDAFGSTVSDCRATLNGSFGINAGALSNCIATSNRTIGIFIISGTVEKCIASSNGTTGIYAFESSVTNCFATNNQANGISSSTVMNCTANNNANAGIEGDTVINSTAGGNKGIGISSGGGSVTNCTARSNGTDGISNPSGSVTNSTAITNGGNGIDANNGVVAFCKATQNNTSGSGKVDIVSTNTARTGNNPAP